MATQPIKLNKAFFETMSEMYERKAKELLPPPSPDEKARWDLFIVALRQSGVFTAKQIAEVDSWSEPSLKKKVSYSFINRYCAYVTVWRGIKFPYFADSLVFNAVMRADHARSKYPEFLMIAIP